MYILLPLADADLPKNATDGKPFDLTVSVINTDASDTVQVVAVEGKPLMPAPQDEADEKTASKKTTDKPAVHKKVSAS